MKQPLPRRPAARPGPDPDVLAAEIVLFLAADDERMGAFLAATGLDVGDLRRAATSPHFAESLLDHLCQDERLLVAFAESHDYDPAAIERRRQALAPPPFEG